MLLECQGRISFMTLCTNIVTKLIVRICSYAIIIYSRALSVCILLYTYRKGIYIRKYYIFSTVIAINYYRVLL